MKSFVANDESPWEIRDMYPLEKMGGVKRPVALSMLPWTSETKAARRAPFPRSALSSPLEPLEDTKEVVDSRPPTDEGTPSLAIFVLRGIGALCWHEQDACK